MPGTQHELGRRIPTHSRGSGRHICGSILGVGYEVSVRIAPMTHPDRSFRPGPGLLAWLIVLVVLIPRPTASAQPPRALPAGKLPDDVRLQPLKDLDGYFPFTPPKTPEEWD